MTEGGDNYPETYRMDPELGRFLSMDPFAGVVSDPETLHKYLYAWANPVNVIDPSGEFGIANVAVTGAIMSGIIGGFFNAIGAQSPRDFVGRFLIGALTNGIATYVAFLVGNPLAQGAIAGGLTQVFTILWEERHDLRGAFTARNLGEVLVAALIGSFSGGIAGEKWARRLLIPKHKDLWQNVWKARNLRQFTKNIRLALVSGAVGGAVGSPIGIYILEHMNGLINTIIKPFI